MEAHIIALEYILVDRPIELFGKNTGLVTEGQLYLTNFGN